jgi:homoserine dehydrogenase
MGCCIKLIGMAHSDGNAIEAYVAPMLIPQSHPLAAVNDSYNAVFVRGDAVDDAMFQGRGAGELPTASAVVGDVFDVARNILHGCNGRISCTCYKHLPIVSMDEVKSKYFLRMEVEDRVGVLAEIATVFASYKVSIEQLLQKQKVGDSTEIVVITDQVCEGNLRKAIQCIADQPGIREIKSTIRVYHA